MFRLQKRYGRIILNNYDCSTSELLDSLNLLSVRDRTREGFLRKNIVAVSLIQNCAIRQYSLYMYISFPLNEITQARTSFLFTFIHVQSTYIVTSDEFTY